MKNIIRFNRIFVFFLSAGFLVLGFEVFLQHYVGLEERPQMWIPIIFGGVGGFFGIIIFILFNRVSLILFYGLMLVSIVVGMMGLYFHNELRVPLIVKTLFAGNIFPFESLTANPPLLAPSAFVAIGTIGALVAFYFPWGKD